LALDGSTISFNAATAGPAGPGNGGGIANRGGLTAVVSTISTNQADGRGGGLHQDAAGSAELINVTVFRNAAEAGGGVDSPAGGLYLGNTVVAGSRTGGDCAVPPVSLGHNLAGDLSCDLTAEGDVQAADPRLSDLKVFVDAGIRTHFPLELSPLGGTGDPSLAPGLDQNGKSPFTYGPMKGPSRCFPPSSGCSRGACTTHTGTAAPPRS
jgi:hypothetical protein